MWIQLILIIIIYRFIMRKLAFTGLAMVGLVMGYPTHDSTHPDYHTHKAEAKDISSLYYNMLQRD